MRVRWMLPLLAIGLAVGCASKQQEAKPAVDVAAISAQADSLDQAMLAAIANRDSNAVANFYADDAHFLPPGIPRVDGKDNIRHAWSALLQTPGFKLEFGGDDKTVSEAGDLVIDLGVYRSSWTGAKGKAMQETGKFITVLKKVNGEWKISHDIFNSDTPTPGM